jgi:UDP-N-acetylmuramoylalanine--D-glutamate ligase
MTQEPRINFQTSIAALVVGLAREGTALTRILAEHGARVTVTDIRPATALEDGIARLDHLPVNLVLGSHPLNLLDEVDLLFVSPGVPPTIPLLVEAKHRGIPISSETRLFTRLCPAQIVGITGSSGKTTTTALTGEMIKATGRRTWVGGNIGRPLIGHLDDIEPEDAVVMELSSFQLEMFGPWTDGMSTDPLFDPRGWSPPIAAMLNITPNHLDRHPSMEAYIEAKIQILKYQKPGDIAILNMDDSIVHEMGKSDRVVGKRLWFSLEHEVSEGAFLRGNELVLRIEGDEHTVCLDKEIQLMGQHNLANCLAATALSAAGGASVEAMHKAVTTFRGVEHRLELVRQRNGVRWYNDSIATTPERTVAALQSFDAPIILLAGGRDKHLPWHEMAALTWRKARHLIVFGEAAALVRHAMQAAGASNGSSDAQPGTHIHGAGTLKQAVAIAAQVAEPGDVVLLSPGGTSFDAYTDFAARGLHFRELVESLE